MRLKIGGFELESLTSDEIMARAGAVSTSSRPVHLVTFNPLMYLDALADPDFAAILRSADLLLAESSGIKWAAKFLYNLKISPLAGIDMLDALFASDSSLAPSSRAAFYFLGGRPGVAESASRAVSARFPPLRIAGFRDGFFDDAESAGIAREIAASGATILLAGLGSPRQEYWIARNKHLLSSVRLAVGVGGSFDVLSGRLRRAPAIFRGLGAEWLWRLMSEPRRFVRIARLPLFVAEIIRMKMTLVAKTQ
ncbi:MAG: glycosyltransferase [Elusimicrobia bacterium HGW-Elusimicrobia-1]|jgi:N-acetylglucosaminyldiphosphoundecaprenol N-acetyl-beta-D-mannosaminyltransferase|nr:MAG: glycosyltransferase [Elusimicrobia bacterium HGW-Elusimicrobia-3]PKN01234.1 MAG: glycosyltransferase [Elusimicrobia bacterium HGW-Elusimicrobia-1]